MPFAYFDTSALIKRYVTERGRREVLRLLRKNECVVSRGARSRRDPQRRTPVAGAG